MSDIESADWSESAASNNATPPNGWPEGMAPSAVNDAARETHAAIKREWNRSHTTISSAGTSTAYTLTFTTAPTAYVNGQRFSFKVDEDCGVNATLNVNSLGAKTIKKMTATGVANLAAGDLQADHHAVVEYDSGGDYFVLITPNAPPDLSSAALLASANTFTAAQTVSSSSATNHELLKAEKTSSTAYADNSKYLLVLKSSAAASDAVLAQWFTSARSHALGMKVGSNDFTLTVNTTGTPVASLVADGTTGVVNAAAGLKIAGKQIDGAAFWAKFAPDGTVSDSFNVTSITDSGTGDWTVNIGTDFATANWACVATAFKTAGNGVIMNVDAQTAGTVGLLAENNSGAATDPVAVFVVGYGDQ